jgi:hypothetical protein
LIRDKLVFVHIGKTAGTSLRLILEAALGRGSCSPPFVQSYMTAADARYHDNFRVICGHISRADQQKWFPDRKVITVLREPIDRCLSFLHYVRRLRPQDTPVAADAHRMSMLDLIETDEAQRNLRNTMVRQLGGHMLDFPSDLAPLLARARTTLAEAAWVGRHDTIAADLERLSDLVGCRLEEIVANKTESRPSIADEDPLLIDRLTGLNDYDSQLWLESIARTIRA